jgi:hypothetical protein
MTDVRGGGAGLLALGALGALGVAGGVMLARDTKQFNAGETWISQGGTPHGTLRASWLGMHNVVGWGVKEILKGKGGWVLATHKAETEARKWENELFHAGEVHFGTKIRIGYDNGPDAFRHTYASASIVYRLMRVKGTDAEHAAAFLHGAGNAHERDSWLHTFNAAHGRYSSEMDVNNNLLGQRLGAMLAERHAREGVNLLDGEAELRRVVLDAIGQGVALQGSTSGINTDAQGRAHAVVMDRIDAAPRAATWGDIAELGPGGTPRRDASGNLVLRVHVPDAPGFPMPIRDGKIDMSLPYAALGPAQLKIPRDDVPQA